MALIIDSGGDGATASHTAAGKTQVIASGPFKSASVQITVSADSAPEAPIFTFGAPGGISVDAAPGATITATVVGGNSPEVSVSCNP